MPSPRRLVLASGTYYNKIQTALPYRPEGGDRFQRLILIYPNVHCCLFVEIHVIILVAVVPKHMCRCGNIPQLFAYFVVVSPTFNSTWPCLH